MLRIPEKLYGRRKEIARLQKTVYHVAQGNRRIITVSGPPGIGKSFLVREALQRIEDQSTIFIHGKFQQLERNVPYHALREALDRLIRRLMKEEKTVQEGWIHNIKAALGPNGNIIINMIPVLEEFIGPQPELPALGPLENQNRFKLYFQKFLSVFSGKGRPLVLFLDDLQWADIASLSLMKSLVSDPDLTAFLLIGAYRSNEINDRHPLHLVLSELTELGMGPEKITLEALQAADVDELICDTLQCDSARARPLLDLINQKTNGNPLFLGQFLAALVERKLLAWVPRQEVCSLAAGGGSWEWDMQKITTLHVTDNVVDLLARKIETLAPSTQEVLKISSCIGDRFDLSLLTVIFNQQRHEVFSLFTPLIREGFLLFYNGSYSFVHDRIQEVAYSLLDEREKAAIHMRIGKAIAAVASGELQDNDLFFVVDQMNAGRTLCVDREERVDLAAQNLWAGRKAKEATAYSAAGRYFSAGIDLLGNDGFAKYYELALSLHTEAAEAAYLAADFELMKGLINAVETNAHSVLDAVKAYEIAILSLIAQNRLSDSIAKAQEVLRRVGVRLPRRPGKLSVALEFLNLKLHLSGKSMADLDALPRMTDPVALAAIRIMVSTGTAAYHSVPDLLPIMIFRVLRLALRQGNCHYSPFYFIAYGFVLCGVLGDIPAGYRFGEYAVRLLQSLQATDLRAKILFMLNAFIRHWKHPLAETLPSLREGYTSGIETGDLEYASLNALLYCEHLFHSGAPLEHVYQEVLSAAEVITKFKQERNIIDIDHDRRLVEALMDDSDRNVFLEKVFPAGIDPLPIPRSVIDISTLGTNHINKAMLLYLFGHYRLAYASIRNVKKYIEAIVGFFQLSEYNFYYSLILCALAAESTPIASWRLLFRVRRHQKKMRRWAESAPENFAHKYRLVEAEYHRLRRRPEAAARDYREAARLAHRYGFLQGEALSCELAARYFHSLGERTEEATHLTRAVDLYLSLIHI